MLDIKEKRHIQIVGKGGGGQAESVEWNDIQNKPEFATVATSGDYDDLTDKPELFSGDYNDLTNKPDLSHYVEDTDLATVATSGSYNDLTDKPTIPSAQVNSDWNASSGVQQILNKPTLATVATSGSYNDLSNTPSLATVATSGSYNDLTNKPTIPTVPPMAIQDLVFTLSGGDIKTIQVYTVPNYFYVEDASGTDNTLQIVCTSTVPSIEVFYSTDRSNWTSMGTTSTTPISATIPANGKLYLKCTADRWGYDASMHNNIRCAKNFNVGGNIMSLLYGDNFEGQTTINNIGAFTAIFRDSNTAYWNKLLNAKDLVLPATTLAISCYMSMFSDCTALTTAPQILPATTLAQSCYQYMFNGCTRLTTAPALPATTLAAGCYGNMFQGCTSLTTAPALPATTLAQGCYEQMFDGCTALTTAPALPVTTLNGSCYSGMFRGCTSLTTAPELPATTLAQRCYASMFANCTALNSVTTYATNITATNCLNNWLNGVSATGDFYNLGGATYTSDTSGIPSGWTEHTSL